MTPRLLDTCQVARRLKVSRRTVYRWLESGRLPEPVKKWGWFKWGEGQLKELLDMENADKR